MPSRRRSLAWGREARKRSWRFSPGGFAVGLGQNRLVRRMRGVGFELKWEEIKSSIALVLSAGQKLAVVGVDVAVKMDWIDRFALGCGPE